MSKKVSFGINLPQAAIGRAPSREELDEFLESVEKFGFNSVWVSDRIFHEQVHVLDPTSLAAYAAAKTRLTIGTSVLILPLRNPVLLAKAVATIDNLSSSGVILGVAVGRNPQESEAVGVPMKQRARRFDEALSIMRRLWTEEKVTYAGKFWTLNGVSLTPKPRRKIPIWIGGIAESVLDRAVRLGDGWTGAGATSLTAWSKALTTVEDKLGNAGRSRESFTLSKRIYIHVDKNTEKAAAVMRRWMETYQAGRSINIEDTCAVGTPAECAEFIRKHADLGADSLILNPIDSHSSQLKILGSEVLPSI